MFITALISQITAFFTRKMWLPVIIFVSLTAACSQRIPAVPTETATAVPSPTIRPTDTPAPTHTPTPTATASPTPTPGPLDPSAIFEKVSPKVVFIDTPTSRGSGLLIEGNYILTNAHVVWPHESVRVVFTDGTEYIDTPVINMDWMADLAVIGPIETNIEPAELIDGEDLIIGSNVYLIGYPGEVEEFPHPTITRGLISRLREWDAIDMTYFQSDATIAGGQSGGVLVSEMGDVIGISGFHFSDGEFALVASAIDALPRIQNLIVGEDVSGLGEWQMPTDSEKSAATVILPDAWSEEMFIVNPTEGNKLEIELTGDPTGFFILSDLFSNIHAEPDGGTTSTQYSETTAEYTGPYFIRVAQNANTRHVFTLRSNHPLTRYKDRDDKHPNLARGAVVEGAINYPEDVDFYHTFLKADEEINIKADSVVVDPFIIVVPQDAILSEETAVADDDSGGGVFGFSAELTYRAPHTGFYTIIIGSANQNSIGGYILSTSAPYPGAPTPIAPEPTATPIASEFGLMQQYTNNNYGFSVQYPADWIKTPPSSPFANACATFTACYTGPEDSILFITVEELASIGMEGATADEYVDVFLEILKDTATVTSRQPFTTEQGATGVLILVDVGNGTFKGGRLFVLKRGLAYNISYLFPRDVYEDMRPVMEHSFSTLEIDN